MRSAQHGLCVLLALVGCVRSDTSVCPNGDRCAAGLQCVEVQAAEPDKSVFACVQPEQLGVCDDAAVAGCLAAGRNATCHPIVGGDGERVCVPNECGNLLVDATETCDDGAVAPFDGCSERCQTERCGNEILDPFLGMTPTEDCDIGYGLTHDGCSARCRFETPRWSRTTRGSDTIEMWRLRWESIELEEACRDADDFDGDGLGGCADPDCWEHCQPRCPPGAPCTGEVQCGDGVCDPRESCRVCADCTCTAICGDTHCDAPETAASCPGDCAMP